MRNRSHAVMGRFLLREYLADVSGACARMFLLGCTQPDKNPATYFKGSLRSCWMRGHNYSNAHRYMLKLVRRLERQEVFSAWDYYCLGKLMHYTMDAFTLPHNAHFPKKLRSHRHYEIQLQRYFLRRIQTAQRPDGCFPGTAAELLRQKHAQYMRLPGTVETDTDYAFTVCCQMMALLTKSAENRQNSPFPFRQEDAIISGK